MKLSSRYLDLAGASVFISGGGSGIGASLTEGFLMQGAKVAFVQRSDATVFCDVLEARLGRRPLFLPCDVTDIDALQAAIAQAAAVQGPVTVLVNNAAFDDRHSTPDLTVERWNALMDVNLRHHLFAAQAVLPGMRAAGGGAIVNFSSTAYMIGAGIFPAYVAAKAAIMGLTRGLAREFGPDGIRVNALMPGWVLTERQRREWVTPEGLAAHLGRQCLKAEILPEDMVEPTLFLASNASRMMTGQALVVDAGVAVTG